ncbi:MAG: hypothetical protein ACE5IM_06960 [Nitrospinota bacterium]
MEKRDLEKMTVTKLREEALKYPDQIESVHGMKKEELVSALMKVLAIPEPEEERKPAPTKPARKAARSKAEIKRDIRALKEERRKALEAGDGKAARLFRRRIHNLKRRTRKMAAAE